MYSKIKNVFSCIFTSLVVILDFYYMALLIRSVYNVGNSGVYLYFTVKPNLTSYLFWLFLCLLPTLLSAILLWRAIVSDGMLLPILLWAMIPITWLFLHFGMFGQISRLTFTSLTEDPENYLQVDSQIADGYTGSYQNFFPEEIPETAENISYYYQYNVTPSGALMRMEASWSLPQEEYDTAKSYGRAQNGTEAVKDGTADRWFYYSDEQQLVTYRVQIQIPST